MDTIPGRVTWQYTPMQVSLVSVSMRSNPGDT